MIRMSRNYRTHTKKESSDTSENREANIKENQQCPRSLSSKSTSEFKNIKGNFSNENSRGPLFKSSSSKNVHHYSLGVTSPLLFDFESNDVQSLYYVEEHEEDCQESSKIEKIMCVIIDDRKFFCYFVICLATLFVVAVLTEIFPNLKYHCLFRNTTIKNCTHFVIWCKDKQVYIVLAHEIDLPKLHKSNILTHSKLVIQSYQTKIFEFKRHKYAYVPNNKSFCAIRFQVNASFDVISRKMLLGMTEEELAYQKALYGKCEIDIQIDSVMKLLLNEIKDPFYLVQMITIIIWAINHYIIYAVVILFTTVISLFIAIYELKVNLLGIQKMARYNCEVCILRHIKGETTALKYNSVDLCPGDIFELPEDNFIMPCDALLISGSAIMNESILTGESAPIIKTHIPNSVDHFNPKTHRKHIVYSGTKILQKRNIAEYKVLAIVLSTAFNTEKGNLIRSILYKIDSSSYLTSDSWKIIVIMIVLTTIGFFCSLYYLISNDLPFSQIIMGVLDLFTIAAQPALPACLAIGISFALMRMKKCGINCLNRSRVNISGQIDLVCFDKTGTLTEDHLDIYGFRPINYNNGNFIFDNFSSTCHNLIDEAYLFYKNRMSDNLENNTAVLSHEDIIRQLKLYYAECLATCHSITQIKGKLIGDPIDVQIFESTKWIINENSAGENYDPLILSCFRHKKEMNTRTFFEKLSSTNSFEEEEHLMKSRYELGVVRRFEFLSSLQRMSVIVKNPNENHFKIYCKGSPEKICELCREDTIPENYQYILSQYTSRGLRVLSLCFKLIKMDFVQSQKLSRETAEHNMAFLGFVIVMNKLKPKSTESIEILQKAGIKTIISTGDNILTALSVARECHIIEENMQVYQCNISMINTNGIQSYQLNCNLIDEPQGDSGLKEGEKETISIGETDRISNIKDTETSLEIELTSLARSKEKRTSKLLTSLYVEILEDDNENDSEHYEDNDSTFRIATRKKAIADIKALSIDVNNFQFEDDERIAFAVTGGTYDIIQNLSQKYLETKNEEYKLHYSIFQIMLKKTKIYARMSPESKTQLIESLKKKQFIVAMCGDGANDIGALRSADVGICLSPEEASMSAHFISNVSEISCIVDLIKEGKASMVTSVVCFKFILLYSLIQFFSTTFLLTCSSYFSEFQFLVVDLFILFPLAILISMTDTSRELTSHRPPILKISFPLVLSLSLNWLIHIIEQCISYYIMKHRTWYSKSSMQGQYNRDTIEPNYDNTIIFLVSYFQYLITIFAFSISKPYKMEITTNVPLCGFLLCAILFGYYLILVPDGMFDELFSLLTVNDQSFRFILILISISNLLLCLLVENRVVPWISEKCEERKGKKETMENFGLNNFYKLI